MQANGQPATREKIEDKLGQQLTEGYRPTLPLWSVFTADTVPQFYLLRDIELMMIHPIVSSALSYFKAGVAGAEFDITCESPEVGHFVQDQCQRYWDRGVPKVQGGYEYGWIGCEAMYTDAEGVLAWDDFVQFSPRDTFLLTQSSHPVGVRVKQVVKPPGREAEDTRRDGKGGEVDLWLATRDVPAKGVWYAHNPRYSQYYGQSQLLQAWKPWRRLGWKDGAEINFDGGFYRFFVGGILCRYPEEDFQGPLGSPATTLDSQGRPRRFARDVARQIAELYKSGAGVGLPSGKYHADMGGGDKWDLKQSDFKIDIPGGVEYVRHLWDQIRYGVGVPPELMEAAETGSGYSGRSIPLEAFLDQQQKIADSLLLLFIKQILRPLVRWNFGAVKWDAKVKRLLETKRQAQVGQTAETSPEKQAMPGPQQEPGLPGQRQQPAAQTPPQQQPAAQPAYGGWPMLSLSPLLFSDRVRELARGMMRRRAA